MATLSHHPVASFPGHVAWERGYSHPTAHSPLTHAPHQRAKFGAPPLDAYASFRVSSALKELSEFLVTPSARDSKNRQKLLRNLRVGHRGVSVMLSATGKGPVPSVCLLSSTCPLLCVCHVYAGAGAGDGGIETLQAGC